MFDESNELMQQQQDNTAPEQMQQPDNSKEYNFNMMREAREEERRRREDAERRAAQYEQYILEQQRMQQRPKEEPDFNIGDDDYVSGAQIKQLIKHVNSSSINATEKMKREYAEELEKVKKDMAVSSLMQNFKDFYTVVNDKSLEKLSIDHPDIYSSISKNPDIYQRGSSFYKMLKGIPNTSTRNDDYYNRNQEKVGAPRSAVGMAAAPSASPLASLGSGDRRVLSEADRVAVRNRLQATKNKSL